MHSSCKSVLLTHLQLLRLMYIVCISVSVNTGECNATHVHWCLQGYQAVYARLGVRLEERGESFYNPMLPGLVQELMDQGVAEESDGAKVIFVKVTANSVIVLFGQATCVCFVLSSPGRWIHTATALLAVSMRMHQRLTTYRLDDCQGNTCLGGTLQQHAGPLAMYALMQSCTFPVTHAAALNVALFSVLLFTDAVYAS